MGFFDSVFADPGGTGIPGSQPHVAVTEWVRRFVMVGGPKIAARLAAHDACEHPACLTRTLAGLRCIVCKRMVCFDHAFFDNSGEGVCHTCANVKRVDHAAPPPPHPNATAQDQALYAAAMASLGLTPSASREEVQKRVKELRLRHHPDRAKPSEAEAAQRAFVTIGQASAVVHKYRGWE